MSELGSYCLGENKFIDKADWSTVLKCLYSIIYIVFYIFHFYFVVVVFNFLTVIELYIVLIMYIRFLEIVKIDSKFIIFILYLC